MGRVYLGFSYVHASASIRFGQASPGNLGHSDCVVSTAPPGTQGANLDIVAAYHTFPVWCGLFRARAPELPSTPPLYFTLLSPLLVSLHSPILLPPSHLCFVLWAPYFGLCLCTNTIRDRRQIGYYYLSSRPHLSLFVLICSDGLQSLLSQTRSLCFCPPPPRSPEPKPTNRVQ